jgi:hypothetical protein
MATSCPAWNGRSASNPGQARSTTSFPNARHGSPTPPSTCGLRTLHHYGLHVSESEILSDPDDREDEALAELSTLADELKKIDPPAFDGYNGFIRAEFLDRWLW